MKMAYSFSVSTDLTNMMQSSSLTEYIVFIGCADAHKQGDLDEETVELGLEGEDLRLELAALIDGDGARHDGPAHSTRASQRGL